MTGLWFCWVLMILFWITPGTSRGNAVDSLLQQLAVEWQGKEGQVEVGGNYVGVEFHHSRPLPSRISFYYPVANSIDLSTDYWQRDQSQPFTALLSVDGESQAIGPEPFPYRYTPFYLAFEQTMLSQRITITYRFCEDLPVMAVEIRLQNRSREQKTVSLTTGLRTVLRTCQSYAFKDSASIEYHQDGSGAVVRFDEADTDSAAVFVLNAGTAPSPEAEGGHSGKVAGSEVLANPALRFRYQKILAPDSVLVITQLIGSCHQREIKTLLPEVQQRWHKSIQEFESRVLEETWKGASFELPDPAFRRSALWSKAMLASNRHYIDGAIVPMPCPAEYNFFFTHDLLLTDLGAVMYDASRVRNDLLYLRSLSKADSILPHAYYWRDDGYKTEFCGSDNWNHLWFIILSGSYFRHSGDSTTLRLLYPMMQKSLQMMLQNKGADDLMYASRPDWWDIGHIYGARAYITILMIRALREYVFLCRHCDEKDPQLPGYLQLAEDMQRQLEQRLWDEKAGYLLNMLDAATLDRHYYGGSLLAAVFEILPQEKRKILLETARRELLDPRLGVRIVMPADFHQLIDLYKFKGMEAGEPYVYINGGVWPQSIVWYALGWLFVDRPDTARAVLKRYFTLEGIRNSPNGQPSFFEYRNADASSDRYGEIDKPTFLWAGGWYLYSLYHLAGLRETPWNIAFAAHLPGGWEEVDYQVLLYGALAKVSFRGSGQYFQSIEVDGRPAASAVFTGPAREIVFQRGLPLRPYLAEADGDVTRAVYDRAARRLEIMVAGSREQPVHLGIVSPFPPRSAAVDGKESREILQQETRENITFIEVKKRLAKTEELFRIDF